jgi:glycosyltransferase involved in cell wall biosynthesis
VPERADRGLHIGVDGRELLGRPTGVGRYLAEILRQWVAQTLHTYSVYIPGDPPAWHAELGDRVRWVTDPGAGAGTWWEQMRLPGLVARTRPNVFFAAGYTAPLRLSCPYVVAIYDVSFCAHPEWFPWREGLRRRWLTRAGARRADRIVTISEFSADEIVRFLRVTRDRIVLAPPGAPVPAPPPAQTEREPIVLFVGSLFNRRRIPELIRTFSAVAKQLPAARLILVGDNRTSPAIDPRALARDLGIADRLEWREYVSDAELEALYWQARVFVFLSEYEGYGMTPMEAIAHEVPAILLDTPVAREVYGDGARLVSTTLPGVMLELLTDDDAHRRQLEAGRKRLARYSWQQSAAVVTAALEAAAHR